MHVQVICNTCTVLVYCFFCSRRLSKAKCCCDLLNVLTVLTTILCCAEHYVVFFLYLVHNRVNEVLFGVCSNDVLFSLSSDEVSQNIEGNRLVRLAGHLLQQQSFSPQFPIPQNLLSQVRSIQHIVHLYL